MTSREQQKEQRKQLNAALDKRARAQLNLYEHQDKLRQARLQHEAILTQANSADDPTQRAHVEQQSAQSQRNIAELEEGHSNLRGEYREANGQVRQKIDAIGNDRERRVAELTAQREHAATRLYHSKHGTSAHRRAEERFNSIKRELHQAQGKKGAYIATRDSRHESEVIENNRSYKLSDGTTRVRDVERYPIRIDAHSWRRNSVGRQQDSRTRRQARRSFHPNQRKATGRKSVDAAHGRSIEDGADPGNEKNIFAQDAYQNQHGTWRNSERTARKLAKDNPDRQFYAEIPKIFYPEKYGSTPTHVNHRVVEGQGKSKKTIREVIHGNFGPANAARKRPLPSAFGANRTPARRTTAEQPRTRASNQTPQRRPAKLPQTKPKPTPQQTRRTPQHQDWAKQSIESSRRRQAARGEQQRQRMRTARVQRQRQQPPTMKKP